MWIVRLALNRPYTFIVASLLIIILAGYSIFTTPVDIFPNINIPVVSVIWNYTGLQPQDIDQRIVAPFERGVTTTVNDIEHIESQSLFGIGVVKIFFQPKVKIDGAIAQTTAIAQTVLRGLPVGANPPLVISYSASSVPIIQLGLSSPTLSEQQLNDIATNFIRTQLATIEGASIPYPYGGKFRQVSVDLDPQELLEKGISGDEVVNAVNTQNLVVPQGTIKIGDREYDVQLNSSPLTVPELNDLPIKIVNGSTVYIHDVAHVRDGFSPQTNIVHEDGKRASLLSIIKSGNASTLDIVSQIKAALPKISAGLPPDLQITPIADQSIFVRAAVSGVVKEAVIAACLTALMILLFLGSWRSTLIVAVSIPLSILTSIVVMSALGETINIMSLGGLALAVGILVDDATVEIENINRLLPEGKPLRETILTGAQQIAVPAFVATLAICIVFVPIFFLPGISGYLFRPLAEAVVFAMLASYLLSRTLVPTLVMYLFRSEKRRQDQRRAGEVEQPGFFRRIHLRFEAGFEHLRDRYVENLRWCLDHRLLFGTLFLGFCFLSLGLLLFVGRDLFPSVDAGQIRLHLRAPSGMRVEETANLCGVVEDSIRKKIPHDELATILDNIGLPNSGLNLSYSTAGTIGTSDAEILISLTEKRRHSSAEYVKLLRQTLPREFPDTSFFFQPADIVSQILNFGLPSPIDVQIYGRDVDANRQVAEQMLPHIRQVPGAADVHLHQVFDEPNIKVDVDRTKAEGIGFTQRDVADSVLVALSNSFQTAPNFWLSPQGITYSVATLTPQYRYDTMQALRSLPVVGASTSQRQVLQNLATLKRGVAVGVSSHYDIQPTLDIYATTQGRDLGGVAGDVQKIVNDFQSKLARGSTMEIRGQVSTMQSSFTGLGAGLLFSILLVYLLMVVNFQSWMEPFIIITALPGALAGITWMLFLTRTTLNVPSLMGSIMCMGVATSNSILMVTFANQQLREGKNSMEAALQGGFTRLRPVLMTALAMMIGMLPMSLGLGEGGEQNAPLGRAVIGGLLLATIATLFFVPVVFSYLRCKGLPPAPSDAGEAVLAGPAPGGPAPLPTA